MHHNAHISPFRYPGGKGSLAPQLATAIRAVNVHAYVEPFAGGAAAAWKLLHWGVVDRVVLNDLDPRIYAAWRSILFDTERFLERLESVKATIEEWRRCEAIVRDAKSDDLFELGFATFFLNRTNRSGIILGAAPIGGYQQLGHWKLDARLPRDTLAERIKWIGTQRDRVDLTNVDAGAAIERATKLHGPSGAFYLIDPPYVGAGSRLYLNTMNDEDHARLERCISASKIRYWMLTYDRSPLIEKLYARRHVARQEIDYSLSRRRKEAELMILPLGLSRKLDRASS